MLVASFAFVFAWQNTVLSQYTIQIFGFLIFLFLIISSRRKGFNPTNILGESLWSIFILNTVILLLIFSTGGFSSSLFFLLYFLVFGVAFILTPVTVFVFVVCVFLIFLPEALRDNVMENLLRIGSLALISPLAYFFGKEYVKGEKQQEELEKIKERTKDAADNISEDVSQILNEKNNELKPKDVEKLNEILEETEDLRSETKE